MKKLETLVKEYDKAENKANAAKQLVQRRVVFKGFHEVDDYDMPTIEATTDGLIAVWRGREIFINIVVELMKTKGYVEPEDFTYG